MSLTKYTNLDSLIYGKKELTKAFLHRTSKKDSNGCIHWTGGKDSKGYGMFKYKNLTIRAHRASYLLRYSVIENDFYVLHRCDNRSCVNIDHLFVGNQQDNMNDMKEKGRSARNDRIGDKNPNAKIKNSQINTILMLYLEIGPTKTAKKFKISRQQVYRIYKKHSGVQKWVN